MAPRRSILAVRIEPFDRKRMMFTCSGADLVFVGVTHSRGVFQTLSLKDVSGSYLARAAQSSASCTNDDDEQICSCAGQSSTLVINFTFDVSFTLWHSYSAQEWLSKEM